MNGPVPFTTVAVALIDTYGMMSCVFVGAVTDAVTGRFLTMILFVADLFVMEKLSVTNA